ncbi:unnamed protein product [Rotaria sp. Silwood1]|nr:unnamed protein product [Rotaria sp. Silwood1]CAF0746550.1 unnamed protein product [Rotaria sp. Silwood1]CAF3335439.1 unnamed protein product [Rotaria sp. Silwood1]CAF3356643.1 unnamed protein product [Rotaria sp. Silwood1]
MNSQRMTDWFQNKVVFIKNYTIDQKQSISSDKSQINLIKEIFLVVDDDDDDDDEMKQEEIIILFNSDYIFSKNITIIFLFLAEQLNYLINQLIIISEEIRKNRLLRCEYTKEFKEKINNPSEMKRKYDMNEVLDRIYNYCKHINMKKKQRKELKAIITLIRHPAHKIYKIGTNLIDKILSDFCCIGDQCIIMPNRTYVQIKRIYYNNPQTDFCICGQYVQVKLTNVKQNISPGFILCNAENKTHGISRVFDAQVAKIHCISIICPGFLTVLHIHSAITEQNQLVKGRFELLQRNHVIWIEGFKDCHQFVKFTLRYDGETVAVGNILQIIE